MTSGQDEQPKKHPNSKDAGTPDTDTPETENPSPEDSGASADAEPDPQDSPPPDAPEAEAELSPPPDTIEPEAPAPTDEPEAVEDPTEPEDTSLTASDEEPETEPEDEGGTADTKVPNTAETEGEDTDADGEADADTNDTDAAEDVTAAPNSETAPPDPQTLSPTEAMELAEDAAKPVLPIAALQRRKKPTALNGRLSRAAMAGEFFEAIVTDPVGLTEVEPHGLRELGLELSRDADSDQWVISGTLHEPRVHEIILAARRGTEDVAVSLRLNVSPDPWSIWKDLPVDWTDLRFQKSDVDHSQTEGLLNLMAASRRGRSHAHKALPRDDDARILFDPATEWHIGIVADGAGSAQFSRKGSEIAVDKAVSLLPQLLQHHVNADLDAVLGEDDSGDVPKDLQESLCLALKEAAEAASKEIDSFALNEELQRRDFSTTLLIGIARHIEGRGWLFASFSVGDGAIALVQNETDQSPVMITPDSGEFAGQTVFLETRVFAKTDTIADRFHARIVSDFDAFILSTDGISDAWFESDLALTDPAGWHTLWNDEIAPAMQSSEDLAEWLNFRIKGEHDDRTIVIMTPPGFTPPPQPSSDQETST